MAVAPHCPTAMPSARAAPYTPLAACAAAVRLATDDALCTFVSSNAGDAHSFKGGGLQFREEENCSGKCAKREHKHHRNFSLGSDLIFPFLQKYKLRRRSSGKV